MKTTRLQKIISIPIILMMIYGFSIQDNPNRNNQKLANENIQANNNNVPLKGKSMRDTGSTNWIQQVSGTTNQLFTVCSSSSTVCWAAGVGPTVIRTTDGGNNWTNATGTGITGDIYNIYAISANTAICTSSPGSTFIYKTTNGGVSWSQVYSLAGGFIDGIQMISATEGYGLGDPVGGKWVVVKTTDGGNTWARMATEPTQVGSEAGWNNSFQILGNNMWFGTNSTRVYHSTNLGVSWTSSATTGTLNTYAVHFNNASNGLAGGDAIVKTSNGGATFSSASLPGTSGEITGLAGNASNWWSIRNGSSVYHSNNHGSNWSTEFTHPGSAFLDIDVKTDGNLYGWVVGNSGLIYAIPREPYYNWGNEGGYHWAGSYYSNPEPPSKPTFCWVDEPGMKLVNNGINRYPGSSHFVGNLDNGRWKITASGSKKIRFYGQNYTNIYISTNGFISFVDFGYNSNPSGYGLPYDLHPLKALFPLFKDFDFGSYNTTLIPSSISVIRTNDHIIITYLRAPVKNNTTDYVSFQVIIELFSGTPTANSRIVFQYAGDCNYNLTNDAMLYELTTPSHINQPDNHLVGFQDFNTGSFMYKASHLIVPTFPNNYQYRPLFNYGIDPCDYGFALEFGPDDTQLNFNCNTVVISPPFVLTLKDFSAINSHTVIFHNVFSPFTAVGSSDDDGGIVLEGIGEVLFSTNYTGTPLQNGQPYYVEVRGSNTISTWSAAPVMFTGDSSNYNFTSSITQAYGNNMTMIDSLATFYSGDVNQDDVIDLSDISLIFNDAAVFATGYTVTDLDGNQLVDTADLLIAFNNASKFVQVIRP